MSLKSHQVILSNQIAIGYIFDFLAENKLLSVYVLKIKKLQQYQPRVYKKSG